MTYEQHIENWYKGLIELAITDFDFDRVAITELVDNGYFDDYFDEDMTQREALENALEAWEE